MRKFIYLTLFTFLVCVSPVVFGQTPNPIPTPVPQVQSDADIDLMQRAQMVSEIKMLRAANVAKDGIITEKNNQIELYKQLNTTQEARIADLKEAVKQRTTANNVEDLRDEVRKEQITDYKAQVADLRAENDKLRKSKDKQLLIVGILGAVVGHFGF